MKKPSRYMNLQALHRVRECLADLEIREKSFRSLTSLSARYGLQAAKRRPDASHGQTQRSAEMNKNSLSAAGATSGEVFLAAPHVQSRWERGIRMRKISLLATTLILIGVGVWANTTNPTPHDAPVAIPVGPSQVM